MTESRKLHASEIFLIAYFTYVALISPFFLTHWTKTWVVAIVAAGVVLFIAHERGHMRAWVPLFLMLIAYREMNWFTPAVHNHHLENVWIVWDRQVLDQYHLRAVIESLGVLIPGYLELCYLLVYAVAPVSLVLLVKNQSADRIHTWWIAHLAATLGCYALFPYFPSEPPRTVFAGEDLPHVTTVLRTLNLAIVGGYGIHSSVFPSAHVASGVSAGLGLLFTLRRRRWLGWLMLLYGFSVALATIYGRYHYAVDAVAGMAMTVPALFILILLTRRRKASRRENC